MLDFARKDGRSAGVGFLHLDATDLAGIEDQAFDFATVLDAVAPLPWTGGGLGIRLVEYSFGHEHYRHFTDFLARGGVNGLLAQCGYAGAVVRRERFWRGCREAVVITGARTPQPAPGQS